MNLTLLLAVVSLILVVSPVWASDLAHIERKIATASASWRSKSISSLSQGSGATAFDGSARAFSNASWVWAAWPRR
jgi:hypothetical protein